MKKLLSIFILSIIILTPIFSTFVYAQTGSGSGIPTPTGSGSGKASSRGVNLQAQLDNPLGTNSLTELITQLLRLLAQIGSVICIFFIIYSGFLFIKAQGDPAELKTAKSVFFWSVVGTGVMLGAFVIAELVQGTVESVTGPIR